MAKQVKKDSTKISDTPKVPYLTPNAQPRGYSSVGTNKKIVKSEETNAFNLEEPVNQYDGISIGVTPRNPSTINSTIPNNFLKNSNFDGSGLFFDKAIDRYRSMDQIMDLVHKTVNITQSVYNTYNKMTEFNSEYYNRFKIANPNDKFVKGIPHVFFVAPMCNIFQSNYKLKEQFTGDDLFEYANKTTPMLLHQLSAINNRKTDFSLLLSNYVKSFSPKDEYIEANTYGKTLTGYNISYGKHDISSKSADSFDITFYESRNLDIYKLHKLWTSYISGSYRGIYNPTDADLLYKILDYTGALYYIVTAEDGETIIFWSKYYGVYPTTSPSSQFAWGGNNFLNENTITISYNYSFKEDYNPFSLIEFNGNARAKNVKSYLPIYDEALGTSGDTFVRRPFIELQNSPNKEYKFLLRFQK